ncbi:unnamed protein product [Arabidopsis thaliana]|uniref:Uncharacterized protein n=1 Tax=Arabidopsis thaliana TaxID=3702 RepID=A0A5S9XIE0_ARATH|nr:unnamed protein product [Arabidopsis thaliana]
MNGVVSRWSRTLVVKNNWESDSVASKILDRKRTKLKKAIQSPLKKKGQISISKYNTNEVRDQILAVGESFSHEQPNISQC